MTTRFGKLGALAAASMILVTACDDAPEEEVAAETQTGGVVSGEALGGTINDDMIPLDELTSSSPPAKRTAVTTQERRDDSGQTVVETSVQTTVDTGDADDGPTQPEPPETPAAPE